MRVEQFFNLLKGREQARPEQGGVVIAARQPVAMLAAHRPLELLHQLDDIVRDRLHALEIDGGLRVDHRAQVQAADRGVPVIGPAGPVSRQDVTEAAGEVGQPRRLDRRILHERNRLLRSGDAQQQGRARFPAAPNLVGLLGRCRADELHQAGLVAQPLFQQQQAVFDVLRGLTHEFDEQQGRRRSLHEVQILLILQILT